MDKLKDMYYEYINSEEYKKAGALEEVQEVENELYSYLENNFHKNTILEIEDLILSIGSVNEMQGYIRGYKNAMETLLACGIKVGDTNG